MTKQLALESWIEVVPPPEPYLHVLRRSFSNGLHVLILVYKTSGGFHVLSSVDHGTPRGTQIPEGFASSRNELAQVLTKACEKWIDWEKSGSKENQTERKRYFYTKPKEGISDPVSRETLFQLLTQGAINWQCQVWEEVESMAGNGRWRPIMTSLGFPPDGQNTEFD